MNGYKALLNDANFIATIDQMAAHYGKTPTEILSMSVFEFNLNMAIYIKARHVLAKPNPAEQGDTQTDFSAYGSSREVIRIKKNASPEARQESDGT